MNMDQQRRASSRLSNQSRGADQPGGQSGRGSVAHEQIAKSLKMENQSLEQVNLTLLTKLQAYEAKIVSKLHTFKIIQTFKIQ